MFDQKLIKNYFYNSGLNILNMLFPLMSFPYISRILGVEGLGEVSFILMFSSYFITLSALGIPIYGIREISIVKKEKTTLNRVFSELFMLNFLSTMFFSILYVLIIFNINYFTPNLGLYLLIGINVIFSFFQIDWLFQGLENYKIITVRSFIAKLLAFTLMILFVNNHGDTDIYLMTNIVALTGANLFNIFYARKYISFKFNNLNLKRHFKPVAYFFASRIMSTVYTIADVLVLGFLVGNYYVGLYIAAIRLNRAVTSIVTSLSAVLLPRSSEYLANKEYTKYNEVTQNSFYFILLFSVSAASFLALFSHDIMILFAGDDFIESVLTMQILTLIIITVAMSNFTGVQILYAHKKESVVVKSITLGAITNLTLNFLLIPVYKHNGAAVATVIAELVILTYQVFEVKKIVTFSLHVKRIFKIVLGISTTMLLVYIFNLTLEGCNLYIRLSMGVLFFIFTYLSLFFLLKENIILKMLDRLKRGSN